jgi:hypothetical protein
MKRFNGGIISGRSFTGHAHGNAFLLHRCLVGLRSIYTTLIAMEQHAGSFWKLIQRIHNQRRNYIYDHKRNNLEEQVDFMEFGAITFFVKDMEKMVTFYRDIMKIPMGCVKLLWLTPKGT